MVDIVIAEFMDEEAVAGLGERYCIEYDPALVDQPKRLLTLAADARALIVRNRTQVRGSLLDAALALECVGRLGVGLDNIDVAACDARGIAVLPASGANDLSVAEYVITAALMLLRGAWLSSASVALGAWPRQALIGRELSGRTMGLVGYGSIARQVAQRAASLGMRCIAYDPFLPLGDGGWGTTHARNLSGLLAEADVISLHTPLTDETRHMIDAGALSRMKAGAVLINAARGGVIDEDALAAALRRGHLGGAALDVFETEPLTREAGAKFADLPNLLLTPHIAGVTEESSVRVSSLIADRVSAHLERRR